MKKKYEEICNEYVYAFLRKHDFYEKEYDEYSEFYWIGNDVGTIIEVADYFIDFQDIKYDIDNDIPVPIYFKYYDYLLSGDIKMNYKTFVKKYKNENIKRIF